MIFFKICILGEHESAFSHWYEKEHKSIAANPSTRTSAHDCSILVCLKIYSSKIIKFLFMWAFVLRDIYLWITDWWVSFFHIVINWHLTVVSLEMWMLLDCSLQIWEQKEFVLKLLIVVSSPQNFSFYLNCTPAFAYI